MYTFVYITNTIHKMSTLKTQYELFLKENPNLIITFEEWERNYLIPKLGKIIPSPENENEDENKDIEQSK